MLRDSDKKTLVKSLIVNLQGRLLDMDENYAESYVNWCIKKLEVNKAHQIENYYNRLCKISQDQDKIQGYRKEIAKVKHRDIPKNIKKGDIVHAVFGVNLGDELSDLNKDKKSLPGHYCIVLAQLGFMFIVVPLTSHPPIWRINGLALHYTGLGLPGIVPNGDSHVLFSQIQRVHIRRIKRIHGISDGKITLNVGQIKELDQRLSLLLGINP